MQLSAPVYVLKRNAQRLMRDMSIPRHQALDQVARGEGFRSWSHLSASHRPGPAGQVLQALPQGGLMLIAARPGQGKTLLGLELAVQAAQAGRLARLFTLDSTQAQVLTYLREMGQDPARMPGAFGLDCSDAICADHISAAIGDQPGLAVVDYLQLLDQRRSLPPLGAQVQTLHDHARATGATHVLLSQIDRQFDATGRRMPGLGDLRLPNPLDLGLIDRFCFLHAGRLQMA